jgi:hypothetical protein
MFSADVATGLAKLDHDARAVTAELRGLTDAQLFDIAVAEDRVAVTENMLDFVALLEERIAAGQETTPVVFALKARLPTGAGRSAARLVQRLHTWAERHPEPFPTAYWL